MTVIKHTICDPNFRENYCTKINLEQVISPEMPRIVSPVILERDIESNI